MNQIEATRLFILKALTLMEEHANETKVRDNFTSFLRSMFPDGPKWVNDHIRGAETHIHLLRNNREISGFIDNCIDSIAIEYEKNLTIPSVFDCGYGQVKEYCAALVRDRIPIEMILGILSDTLRWHVYEIVPDERIDADDYNKENIILREIDSIEINNSEERSCVDLLLFLQKYLGRQGGRQITAKRLASDFGLRSNYSENYRNAIHLFVTQKINSNPSYYSVIEDLWNKLVESHSVRTDNTDIYISEYYISIIGKMLCANLLSKKALSSNDDELCSIINGEFFENRNIQNFADYDYFGWLNCDMASIIPVVRMIQDDLKVYDFEILPAEDLFGELMVQLANRTQRILLGQELTPIWLAHQLVERVIHYLPMGVYPQFVDMCCGSGSMIVETIKCTESMLPQTISADEKNQIIQNCISGFDIDPLAVLLAKINWLINVYPKIDHDSSVFIPVYHADSLFAENHITRKTQNNEANKLQLQLFDKIISMPSYAVSSDDRNIFDTIVNKCYDCVHYNSNDLDHEDFTVIIKEVLSGLVANENQLLELCGFSYDLYKALYQLNSEGKNGIWAFVLKNTFRPSLITAKFNGIVTNTPWLAMSKIGSNPYKESLRLIANRLGINPVDSSFPHLEMATVFLLSSISRFLMDGGVFGCILPDSVLTGFQHNKFRNGEFNVKNIKASFNEIWELPVDTFKNKSISLFGKKEVFNDALSYPGRHYDSKDSYKDIVFNVIRNASKVVWTSDIIEEHIVSDQRYSFKQGADIMPRCFFFFTNHVSRSSVSITSIKANEEYSYFLKDMKIGKDLSYSCNSVPKALFKPVLVSNILTPFTIGTMPLGLLPIKKVDGVWSELDNVEVLSCKRPVLNLLNTINQDYSRIQRKHDIFKTALNFRNKLVQQVFRTGNYLVVYGAGGANICAAYMKINQNDDIIVDQTLYWTIVDTEDEAQYISAVLNCPSLTDTISSFQPQGIFGKRHIHTLPLEYIPKYNSNNHSHVALVNCARDIISGLRESINEDWMNPNKSTLSLRRKRIVCLMKSLPSYDAYAMLCDRILRSTLAQEPIILPVTRNVETCAVSSFNEGCIPLYSLRAACGYFDNPETPEPEGWIDATGNGFSPDPQRHFAVHAKGDSMEPKIKDGDICVFEWYQERGGSRNGEIVLTRCNDVDPDYDGKFTIKRYYSEKTGDENGDWEHTKIQLQSLNPDYASIDLNPNEADQYRTIGILKAVL